MAKKTIIQADAFADAIGDIMQEISEETTQKVFAMVDEAADKCNETAQQYLYKGHGVETGDYKQHFAVARERLSKRHHKATWHVEAPEYRLTHLPRICAHTRRRFNRAIHTDPDVCWFACQFKTAVNRRTDTNEHTEWRKRKEIRTEQWRIVVNWLYVN